MTFIRINDSKESNDDRFYVNKKGESSIGDVEINLTIFIFWENYSYIIMSTINEYSY